MTASVRVFLVRVTDTREPVGIFWCASTAEMWDLVDEITDPGVCEYRPLSRGGLGWPGRVPPMLRDDEVMDLEGGDKALMKHDEARQDVIYCEDTASDVTLGGARKWKKVPRCNGTKRAAVESATPLENARK